MRFPAAIWLIMPVFLATGCNSILAPEKPSTTARPAAAATASGASLWEAPSQGQVPVLAGVTTEVENGQWILRATLIPRDPNPFYSVSQAGGWSLQIFFDTDQQATGYSDGYEFETGWWADEVEPFAVRGPIPECCDFGSVSGYAGMQTVGDRITVRVPLSAIHDDGGLRWRIDTYATEDCDICEPGVTSSFSDVYTGTTSITLASIAGTARTPQLGRTPRTP